MTESVQGQERSKTERLNQPRVAGDADAPPTLEASRQRSKPYRVLHISDVHFGSQFDESVWNYVCALAEREEPDLIACTGDIVDHGGLFMLAAAKLELEKLREAVGPKTLLRCVRGNHDCGPFGNVNIWPFSSNFAAIFGPQAMSVPSWMSSYLVYRKRHWALRIVQRLALTLWLYCKKWVVSFVRWQEKTSLYSLPILREDDPAPLVLVYLDSNYTQLLATGNVNPADVALLKSKLLNLRDEVGGRPFVPRIALVHHHPLPIPEASIKEGLTSFEPFLVLRNAGFVLRELSRSDIDLVLHGHKHYSAFGRLGYSVDHKLEGEIAVLAAGSCGVTLSAPGRNSVNLIDVFEAGRMSYTAIYFGGGGGVPVNQLFRNKREVHGMEMHKARVHRRAAERQGQWIEKVTHAVAIDPGGVAVVRHDVNGHVFDRSLSSDVIPVYIGVSMGRVAHTTLELTETSKRAGHSWVDQPTAPKRSIRCGINLGHRLITSPPADYGYQYVCFNTYAVTEWETITACLRDERVGERRGRAPGLEFTSFVVRVPIRTLVFRVQLPPDGSVSEPFVRVMRWSRYPDTLLDDARHFINGEDGEWVPDTDLTEHEAGNLVHIGSNAYELRISFPFVGYRYDVIWRVDSHELKGPDRREETARRGRAESYRKALLEDSALQRRLEDWGGELREWLSPHFHAHLRKDNDLEIAVFVYDRDTQSLRQMLACPGQGVPSVPLVVPLGEGVVGAAFKRSEFVIYIDPALTGSKDDAAYLYDEAPEDMWKSPKWKFVAAFPVFALEDPLHSLNGVSFDDWGPQTTVGVLTISSTVADSGLLSLTEDVSRVDGIGDDPASTPVVSSDAEVAGDDDGSDGVTGESEAVAGKAPGRPTAQEVWGLAHLLLYYIIDHDEPRKDEASP